MAEQQEAFSAFLERIEKDTLEKGEIHKSTVVLNELLAKELNKDDIHSLFAAIAKNDCIVGVCFVNVEFEGTTPKQIYEEVRNNIRLRKISVFTDTKGGEFAEEWKQIQDYLKLNEAIEKVSIGKGKWPRLLKCIKSKNGKTLDLTETDIKEEQLERLIEAIAEYDIASIQLSPKGQQEFLQLFKRLSVSNSTADTTHFFDKKGVLNHAALNTVKDWLLPKRLCNCIKEGRLKHIPSPFTFKNQRKGGVLDLSKIELPLEFVKKIAEAIINDGKIVKVRIAVSASEENSDEKIPEIKKILEKKAIQLRYKGKKQEDFRLKSSSDRSAESTIGEESLTTATEVTTASVKGQDLIKFYNLKGKVKKEIETINARSDKKKTSVSKTQKRPRNLKM